MHSCAVHMRAWVCAYNSLSDGARGKAALFVQLTGSTHTCVCLCTVRGQIQWCAGASSHQLTRPNSTHLFPTLCSVSHAGILKLAMVGIFIPQKPANVTNQDFFFLIMESRLLMLTSTLLTRFMTPETKPIAAALVAGSQTAWVQIPGLLLLAVCDLSIGASGLTFMCLSFLNKSAYFIRLL